MTVLVPAALRLRIRLFDGSYAYLRYEKGVILPHWL